MRERSEAFEALAGRVDAPWLITCEHASERLPAPYRWSAAEQRLLGTHWAVDIGAAPLVVALAARLQLPAVLARFSRLVIDANRSLESDTLFRTECDGVELLLNKNIGVDERERRIDTYHRPFHQAVSDRLTAYRAADVLSIHSFTPTYEGGEPRWMELGVLYDHDEELAMGVAAHLRSLGLKVALNEPYSGRSGGMYSGDLHAQAHGRRAIEIEVRQDLAGDVAAHPRLLDAIQGAMDAVSG